VEHFRAPAIEVEVESVNGEVRVLKCAAITKQMMSDIDVLTSETDTTNGMYGQMAIFFGGKTEDYADLDARVVSQAILYMAEQLKKVPTGRQGMR
jgi:hypothetical protein